MNTTPETFSAAFAALYAAHQVGDMWIQRDRDAQAKGRPGWIGRVACAHHVGTLTLTKLTAVLAAFTVTGLPIRPAWWTLALGLDATSHYWADRRTTLRWLADHTGKGPFFRFGAPREGRDDNPSLGTGALHLDQAFHVGWLFIAALIISAGAR